MQTKQDIVQDWIARYTGTAPEEFGDYVLLTNFYNYVTLFAERFGVEVKGQEKPMQTATHGDITIVNFGMGSAMAATVMDLLTAVRPKAALFLGKCGGLKKKTKVGDLILPIAAIRGEGTSSDYMPVEVPALPSFNLHKEAYAVIKEYDLDYWTGTVYTTNRRVWEHDQRFKKYLRRIRSIGIDMETATLFTVGFFNKIPRGAILLVSDQPMTPEGVKTSTSDKKVTNSYVDTHLSIGIKTMQNLASSGESVKHLRYE